MFEVRMPREIKAYKEKIVLGMTTRQLICNGIAVVICVPSYILLKPHLNEDLLMWGIFGISGIMGVIGYYTKNGMTAEKYLGAIIKYTFITPQKRKFVTETAIEHVDNIEYQETLSKLEKLSKKGDK